MDTNHESQSLWILNLQLSDNQNLKGDNWTCREYCTCLSELIAFVFKEKHLMYFKVISCTQKARKFEYYLIVEFTLFEKLTDRCIALLTVHKHFILASCLNKPKI